MPIADTSLSRPAERLALVVERSLLLDALIDQAWRALELNGEARHTASAILCGLSLDHGRALRLLIGEVPPSAIALLRPQYEGLVRAVWARHCASDADLKRLFAELTTESQRAAKRLPGITEMLEDIGKTGPRGAEALLGRARARLMDGMNSYVHGGIHPFRRGQDGYPIPLLVEVLKNSNGMSMLTLAVLADLRTDAGIAELMRALHVEFELILPQLEPFSAPP